MATLRYYSESGEIGYQSCGAAGIDLPFYDTEKEELVLQPGESALIKTGIYLEIPNNNAGLLDTRSSTGKCKVDLLARTLDPDFRGNIRLMVINHNEHPVQIKRGDYVAQVLILPCPHFDLRRVDHPENLSDTSRGEGGFGSTGRTITVLTPEQHGKEPINVK